MPPKSDIASTVQHLRELGEEHHPWLAKVADLILAQHEALKPFAEFADPRHKLPADFQITMGSSFGKRQLIMGDCYNAKEVYDGR